MSCGGREGRPPSRSTFEKLRMVQSFPGGPSTINRETGGGHSSQNNGSLNAKITYELDARTSIIGEAFGGGGNNPSRGHANFVGLTPDFESFTERSRSDFTVSYAGIQLSLDHKGKKDGETLKASVGTYGNPTVRQPIRSEFGDGDFFSSDRDRTSFGIFSHGDWVHPIGKDKILSVGFDIGYFRNTFDYSFASSDEVRFGPDFRDSFVAREVTPTAYATFQKTFGTWTIMPGIRLESIDRKITESRTSVIQVQPDETVSDGPYRAPAQQDRQHDAELQQADPESGLRGGQSLPDRDWAAGDPAGQSPAAWADDRRLRAEPALLAQVARRRGDILLPRDRPHLVEHLLGQ